MKEKLKQVKRLLDVYDKHTFVLVIIMFIDGYINYKIRDSFYIDYSITSLSGIIYILLNILFLFILLIIGALLINRYSKK